MALLFQDGMDHYATADTLNKYTSGVAWGSMQTGLLGTGQCGRLNAAAGSGSGPQKAFATTTTLVMGFRYRYNSALPGTNAIMFLYDGTGNVVASLVVTSAGALAWYRGNIGTQVAISANGLITTSAINFIEFKVTLATTATGTIQVRLNGADAIASTGSVQTANTTASTAKFQPGNSNGGAAADFDDLYLYDTTGTAFNTFAGDFKIVTDVVTGAGRIAQFAANGAASNYLCVNQTTPDGDTTYVTSATAGQIDAYATGGIGSATAVGAVQVCVLARKDDANTRTLAIGVGNGATENFDAGTNLGAAYAYLLRQLSTNPLTGLPWATGDFPGLQAAIKCIA